MKVIATLLTTLFISVTAQADKIQFFEGSWDEALKAARDENKLMFVDVYAEWCGPCKVMALEVFTDDKVADFYNDRFINYKLDMEDESQNGPAIASRYKVPGLPFYLYLNGSGDVMHVGMGGMEVEEFLAEGKKAESNKDSPVE